MFISWFVALTALAVYLCYLYVKRNCYEFWQRRGFFYDQRSSGPFGCLGPTARGERSMGMAIYDVYKRTAGQPYVGINLLYRPALLIRDVELAHHVMVQDFASFHDRGVYVDEKNDPLSANLFGQRGKDWLNMRQKLAPCFTSGKLKAMFSVSEDVGDKMIAHMQAQLKKSGGGSAEFELKDILTTYAIDIIASVIFGLEVNSFENPKNEFRTLINLASGESRLRAIFGMVMFLCPPVVKFLHLLGLKNEIVLKLREIMADTIAYREKNNVVRKDMLQLLMQLRNTGEVKPDDDDSNWLAGKENETGAMETLTLDGIAAQGFVFYAAGQETTAMTTALTIFELAQDVALLERAQTEVDSAVAAHDGRITYESLQAMDFIELCLMETNRKYPGLPMLNRECTQDYHIPGTDHVIAKGTPIVISAYGIHMDPAHFPDPTRYDPERFLPENAHKMTKNAYMPFGLGPRHCIAQRMGRLNAKLALVKLLQAFNFETLPRQELVMDTSSVGILPKHGIKVKLSPRSGSSP